MENYASTASGLRAGAGGTLCVWAKRLPSDFSATREQRDAPQNRTRLIICAHTIDQLGLLSGGVVHVPPLSTRVNDVERIIDEYARDAIRRLGARASSFTEQDHAWLVEHKPATLAEIERATLRRVALSEYGGVTAAAEQLGLTHSAFSRWLARRARRRNAK